MKIVSDQPRPRAAAFGALSAAAALLLAALAGCGGGGGDDGGLDGTWRVVEIGTAVEGTTPCPREVEVVNGVTVSCGAGDTAELGAGGQFRAVFAGPQGGAPATVIGTWSSGADERTLTIALTESRQDENGDGRIDGAEVLTFDPPLTLSGAVRERSASRVVLDLTLRSPFGGQDLSYRQVWLRR